MAVEPIDLAAATATIDAALPLATERLLLRRFRPADLDAFRAYQLDPGTLLHLWRAPSTEEGLRVRVSGEESLETEGHAYGIAIERSGELVGETVVKVVDAAARQAEIGWIVAPAHRRQGYAVEAARATLEIAWRIGAHRVTAVLDHDNRASARVAERLGMRLEALHLDDGVNPATGDFGSTEIWAILESER